MSSNGIEERLDQVIAALKLGFADQIGVARTRIRADAVAAAILDATADGEVRSADVQKLVARKADVTERTVRNRLQELVDVGALRQGGATNSPTYRTTGLI